VDELPADDYEAVGLPATARPADFFDRYDRGGERGYPAESEVWESVVALPAFEGKTLRRLELRPIALGFGLPRAQRGRPVLARGESARRILERLARLSEPFGTRLEITGEAGLVVLPGSAQDPSAP
jgi:poly-gamma-glutamate synthesis protein (capsule biosynthesis protein)